MRFVEIMIVNLWTPISRRKSPNAIQLGECLTYITLDFLMLEMVRSLGRFLWTRASQYVLLFRSLMEQEVNF